MVVSIFISLFCLSIAGEQVKPLAEWRAERFEQLSAPHGWMSQVLLQWLLPGKNQIHLPRGTQKILEVTYQQKTAGQPATVSIPALNKAFPKLTEDQSIPLGDLLVQVIVRDEGVGIRVRDPQSAARKKYKRLRWFPEKKEWIVTGGFLPFEQAQWTTVQDSSGREQKLKAVGKVTFEKNGSKHSLIAFDDGEDLFIPFRDKTSGKETYGAARFLSARVEGNQTTLDFNRAYNPPCAFTKFATCPYPPRENTLEIAVEAGEKKP